jgi:hypothetical protein
MGQILLGNFLSDLLPCWKTVLKRSQMAFFIILSKKFANKKPAKNGGSYTTNPLSLVPIDHYLQRRCLGRRTVDLCPFRVTSASFEQAPQTKQADSSLSGAHVFCGIFEVSEGGVF